MKNRIFIFASLVVILTFGFLYVNQSSLASNDKDCSMNCTMSSCQMHKTNTDIKAGGGGGEWATYEFVTDKACCEEMKTSMQTQLMSFSGVKDVKFSKTCNVSSMTSVIIYYSKDETNEASLTSLVKDKEYDCPKDGSCPPGKCNMKKNSKNI